MCKAGHTASSELVRFVCGPFSSTEATGELVKGSSGE